MHQPSPSKRALFALVLFAAAEAGAQQMPQTHIPPSVFLEVALLERTFEAALARDCAPDRCFSKGCIYGRHQTVDLPRSTSLPGLPADEGIGSVPAQEYLTEARCEFTHEKTTAARDVEALTRRLAQRLSRGWLKVEVASQVLEPVSKKLAESATPDEVEPKPPEPVAPPAPVPPAPPPEWTTETAIHELWSTVLPHVPWMIAIVLVTLAASALIWAARRLGAAGIEERMLEAQLAAPPAPPVVEGDAGKAAPRVEVEEDASFADQQQRLWLERISRVESSEDDMIVELLREWLRAGELPMLARALLVFGDRLPHAFAADSNLALKKIEFAEYFRDVDPSTLPSHTEFFRRLNQHAMSSLLMSQEDVQLYRALREDFGSGGVLALMEKLPPRYAALLFALVPREGQQDVARMMSPSLRLTTATQLLASTRISKEESDFVFACIGAAREGRALPQPPKSEVTDRGPSIDAASALSMLLPHVPAADREALFQRALNGSTNAPQWFEDIFFGEMLGKLPPEVRNDLLLDVDVRGLAAWLSTQDLEWQRAFTAQLSTSLQNALRGNSAFSSRTEQLQLARKSHQELTRALKGQYARGRARFLTLVS